MSDKTKCHYWNAKDLREMAAACIEIAQVLDPAGESRASHLKELQEILDILKVGYEWEHVDRCVARLSALIEQMKEK